MLCIGRNECQSIIIGKPGDVLTEPIVITVCPVPAKYRARHKIGITAQRDIAVVRTELVARKESQGG